MQTIQVKDKSFSLFIPEKEILKEVKRIATQINKDFKGEEPVFLAVLNGSFIFAADLMKEISLPCEISFVKLASYQGVSTTGQIREVIGLNIDLTGRRVIIVEDIVDTGVTLNYLKSMLAHRGASSIRIAALLDKTARRTVKDLKVDYVCFDIPDAFVVGYGLDYDQTYRNLPDIGVLSPKVYEGK